MAKSKQKRFTKDNLISFRIDDVIKDIMMILIKDMGLNRSEFMELAIIDFITKIDRDLKYNGVDFKEYAQIKLLEKLRNIESAKRNETISRHLFIERVNYDVAKYIFYKRTKEEVVEMLNKYKNTAKHYKTKKPIEEIDRLLTRIEKEEYNVFEEDIKREVGQKLKTQYYLEKITK